MMALWRLDRSDPRSVSDSLHARGFCRARLDAGTVSRRVALLTRQMQEGRGEENDTHHHDVLGVQQRDVIGAREGCYHKVAFGSRQHCMVPCSFLICLSIRAHRRLLLMTGRSCPHVRWGVEMMVEERSPPQPVSRWKRAR